jgi:hypothetical protein
MIQFDSIKLAAIGRVGEVLRLTNFEGLEVLNIEK